MRLRIPTFGLLVGSLLLGACGETGGILLVPTPDSAWNSESQVVGNLDELQLLLDGRGGFAASSAVDGAEFLDVDGDGELEILFRMPVAGRSDLPWIRLEAGQNPEQAVALRLRGVDATGRVLAYGGLEARPLFDGPDRLNIPFDLSQSALPPFVVAVGPGNAPAGSSLAGVAFFASRPLDAESLEGRAHLFIEGVGELSGAWRSRDACPDGVQMWIFEPAACWPAAAGSLALRLSLDEGVRDLAGQELVGSSGLPGFSLEWSLTLAEFGACQALAHCSALEPSTHRLDLRCDPDSGLLEPAECSHAPDSCLGPRSQFGVVAGPDTAACAGFRPGAVEVEGACVIMDAWPCLRQSDCRSFGAFECDYASGQCLPDACLDSCPSSAEFCVPDWGCQPGLGACLESCAAYGACADFTQSCARREDGLWTCR